MRLGMASARPAGLAPIHPARKRIFELEVGRAVRGGAGGTGMAAI
jgi:hypothetical protein